MRGSEDSNSQYVKIKNSLLLDENNYDYDNKNKEKMKTETI